MKINHLKNYELVTRCLLDIGELLELRFGAIGIRNATREFLYLTLEDIQELLIETTKKIEK